MTKFNKYLFILASLSLTSVTLAQGSNDKVRLFGFGSWNYGNTNGNKFLAGSEPGDYKNTNFSLVISASPHENLKITVQPSWTALDVGMLMGLDYGFAEWFVSDAFSFRIGKVKHPFGIYTEIYDVGTLRPFSSLPQGVYGNQGLVAEAYKGAGITGSYLADSGWGVQYDAYGGMIIMAVSEPWNKLLDAAATGVHAVNIDEAVEEHVSNMLGARLIFFTPLSGLSFGFSGYFGDTDDLVAEDGTVTVMPQHKVVGTHVEYLTEKWVVRGEYAGHRMPNRITIDASYLEVAYKLTEHWQVATHYDWSNVKLSHIDLSPIPSLQEHKALGLGLNYWFSSNFVLKASYQNVSGNRFALPARHDPTRALDTKTTLFQFGTDFSF